MKVATKQELLREIKSLPSNLAKDVLNFVVFVKYKNIINPGQSYFWTRKWQKLEKEAEKDIKEGRIKKYSSVKEFKAKMGD